LENDLSCRTVKPPVCLENLNKQTYEIFEKLTKSQKEKKIEIFDFWCEPLIPLYVNEEKIRDSNNNCLILYFRLNTTKFNYDYLINKINKNLNISPEGEILAFFNGFGIFDLVFLINFESYLRIPFIIKKICSNLEDCLYESCSLICATAANETNKMNNEKQEIPFSILMKTNLCTEEINKWKDIENLAKEIGITRIFIEKINRPMSVTYKQGLFDIVFIGHGTLNQFNNFCRLLESLPFIKDINTVLNLDILCN